MNLHLSKVAFIMLNWKKSLHGRMTGKVAGGEGRLRDTPIVSGHKLHAAIY